MSIKNSSFAFLLLFLGSMPLCAQFTQWKGLSSDWNDPNNWTSGIPSSSFDARISLGSPTYFDPYVPAPSGSDTAKCKNLQVQSGGYVHFADGGILVVFGTDKLQNDGSVFLGNGKIIFKNNITFLNGGTFDAGSGTLDFQGVTWDNKTGSTFTPGTSSIVLNGTTPQTIQGNITFYDIEVANTSGSVTFSGNITVTNSLVIDPGVSVTLSSGSLTLTSSATLDVGAGSTLTINGTFNNSGTITGSGMILSNKPFLRSVIASSETSVDVTFSEAVDATSSQSLSNYSINEGIIVSVATRDASNHAVVHLSISPLVPDMICTLTVNNVIDEAESDTIAANSQKNFMYSSSFPLPVQLASFTAIKQDFTVRLGWSTQTETNNYGFEIERKAESNRQMAGWQKIGFVAGSGTSTAPRAYGYIDANLSSDRYAYRIKQIDNDGTFAYYGNAEVEVGIASREFKLESNYPNPFNPTTTIEFTLADDGRATLKVYNMIGQEVATLFDDEGQAGKIQRVKFDASRLPSGLYFAKLEAGKQQMMRKMMLVK